MGILKLIEWSDTNNSTVVYKYNMKNNTVNRGSKLTVREGQNAIFCHKGKMADVFEPGFYTLDTDSVPLLTKLMGWKYGFQDPFQSEIYFVNTRLFTKTQWGTKNPITVRDQDYGAIQIRGYGSFSFRIDDAYVFMTELSGPRNIFSIEEITDYLKSMIIMGVSDTIAESKVPFLDLAANLFEFGDAVTHLLQPRFNKLGLKIEQFNFENLSLPTELDSVMKETIALRMKRATMDIRMQDAQAQALINASKNPGAGGFIGAGMGLGMGAFMGKTMNDMMAGNTQTVQSNPATTTPQVARVCSCGATLPPVAKFCPSCGKPAPVPRACPQCGVLISATVKFCPECGSKL
ncbi:MAG: SPFH domain-containing protein [Christensenellaceae bacterium]|jgi:membrane protease subunit (stomatin/prohibitin family)|nr:SPFH domain-containing protein [Christensenellaceae bacterium]